MAYDYRKFYIDGRWVDPVEPKDFTVINPATEASAGVISLGSAKDVDRAVAAARRAFESFAQTSREERRALLEKVLAVYKKRYQDIATAIREEMGAPATLAKGSQAGVGVGHISAMVDLLKTFEFESAAARAGWSSSRSAVCPDHRGTGPSIRSRRRSFRLWPPAAPWC